MKLTILQEKLKEGLSIVEKISLKSLTLPILNNILISAEKNFLNLSSTDLEIGINWWSLSKIEEEGKITIPSKLFSNFINLLPNKKINIKTKNNDILIECENYFTQIKGLSSDEFPIIPNIKKNEFISLKSSIFCQSLNQIVDIPLLSNSRPEISGIYFLFQKNAITMVSTDSFRLGEKKIIFKNEQKLTNNYSLILPQKTAKEIINIFNTKDRDLNIYLSSNQIMFETLMTETNYPEIQVVSKLIEGEYPDYKEIIPLKYNTQIILNKDEFLNRLRISGLFTGKTNEVKIKTNLNKNELEIFNQNKDIGEYNSKLPVKIMGENIEVCFNYKFLIDGISNIKSSEIILELNGDDGPAILKPVGDDTYIYVVMPIKSD
ncbi:MAG TPA: DNA polymerase III subunit beta [Candidatus Pacearchaeota archaeon]|nr:DNA polymerase III subunit beta [Candidatus Pacearchaeota archaeon]HOL90555.1 DNA polymerase III subunit beta [Candidatus Pacearchaeota archaeon]